MRRPPEVGQAGLYLVLLLGVSGCAGFPQRTTGSSPWAAGSDDENASPPGLFSWWHRGSYANRRHRAKPHRSPESATRRSQRHASRAIGRQNPWPETQSEWVARNFPRFNRLWNGTPAGGPLTPATRAVDLDQPHAGSARGRDRPSRQRSRVSDRAVRPTDGAFPDDRRSSADRSGSRAQNLDDLPFSPTPPPVKSPRQATPEPANDRPAADDDPRLRADLQPTSTERCAERASFQPKTRSAAAERHSRRSD